VGNEWLHYFAELEILAYGAILLVVALFLPSGLISLPQNLKPIFRSASARNVPGKE
jgi:ABC-type branched-subunit amino acid transport system permease subunit